MKKGKLHIGLTALILAVILGMFLQYYLFSTKTVSNNQGKKPLYWIDTMEPTVHYPSPGKSHMGMELVPVYAENDGTSEAGIVRISPQVVDNLGIRTAPVTKGSLARVIQTVAFVKPNENKIDHIHTYTAGWVRNLAVKAAGEPVKKGQLLFQLYSPLLTNAQEEYLIALQSKQADLILASQKKLQAIGVSDQQIQMLKSTKAVSLLIDVFSPQDGFVTELNIRQGMEVNPEMTLMSIVDLTTVWMMAQVFEEQANWVKTGELAEAQFTTFPGKIWKGEVEYVYPEVDPTTRTLQVRFRFNNPDNLIKPNMYADVTLFTEPKQNILSIPLEALIRSSTGSHVIVALDQGKFQVRPVVAGMESSGRVGIISGLNLDEQVVISGQFLIDSEANLNAGFQRLETPIKPSMTQSSPTKYSHGIMGQGVIKAIQLSQQSLTLQHQPIVALNWPAMTMEFSVAKNIDLRQFNIGDSVQFTLQKMDDNQLMIIQIQKH